MPRANRYYLPGQIAHVTHRCHNRNFLLRFDRDRRIYRWWLWEGLRRHPVALLAYAITSNHVHLLVRAEVRRALSDWIQLVHGRVAQQYVRRKQRSGAFWADRFHVTMVESGEHLRRCLLYIELNMVRARAVDHPGAWRWCSYTELRSRRQRHRILDTEALLQAVGAGSLQEFLIHQDRCLNDSLSCGGLARQAHWTENIAVGSEAYVRAVAAQTKGRQNLRLEAAQTVGSVPTWFVRETTSGYESGSEKRFMGPFPATNSL